MYVYVDVFGWNTVIKVASTTSSSSSRVERNERVIINAAAATWSARMSVSLNSSSVSQCSVKSGGVRLGSSLPGDAAENPGVFRQLRCVLACSRSYFPHGIRSRRAEELPAKITTAQRSLGANTHRRSSVHRSHWLVGVVGVRMGALAGLRITSPYVTSCPRWLRGFVTPRWSMRGCCGAVAC